MPLSIEVFSDLVCPWCFIGKRRLDRVLASPAGEGVEVRWRAYQLAPRLPADGIDRAQYYQSKFGSDGKTVPKRIAEEAATEGLTFNFAAISRMPNTFLGHRLMVFAEESQGPAVQHRLAEVLFRAYFQEGRDVGNLGVLLQAAAAAGLDAAAAEAWLATDAGSARVQAELDRAVDLGIQGVPCFVLGGAFPIPGAQTVDVMTTFIERAKTRLAN
jgi:predicted DsbA family dithiol-disulfide isomerase